MSATAACVAGAFAGFALFAFIVVALVVIDTYRIESARNYRDEADA